MSDATTPKKRPRQRRLRNYLLDARYQLAFTLPMVLLAATLFAGLGYVAMQRTESSTKIGISQLESSAAFLEDSEQTRDELLRRERLIDLAIVFIGILLCLGLMTFGIVLSHRVAGPMYRLRVELGRLRDGDLAPALPLRSGDDLVRFYDRFCRAQEAVRERERRDAVVMRRVLEAAEADGIGESEQLAALRARVEAKEAALG